MRYVVRVLDVRTGLESGAGTAAATWAEALAVLDRLELELPAGQYVSVQEWPLAG